MKLYKNMSNIGDPIYEHTSYYKLSPNGTKILHREDGPAVEYKDGTKYWFINGKCHREDGPASIFISHNGRKKEFGYFLNDIKYEEKEYWAIVKLGAFA